LLQRILRQRLPLEDAFDSGPSLKALAPRDRAFVRLLVATVLRRLGQIDAIVARCLERPLGAKAQAAQDILRLGAAQLLYLDTPPHAAVDTSVDLAAEGAETAGFKALINAVLRRIGREKPDLLAATAAPSINTPAWLWESWINAYGETRARAIAQAHLREPPLDFSVKSEPDAWASRLEAMVLPTGSLRRQETAPVESLTGFSDGAWWVQDAAAALPVTLLGPVAGKTVIDLCAAPGGKTAQLASLGAAVTAVDRASKRLERLTANLARLNLSAKTVTADAAAWRPAAPADALLLDAPCSATGTIRRHPDVAWLKRPEDVAKLADLQARLLRAAVGMIRPGGTLIYCTCSLQPEEGPRQIAGLLTERAPVERQPIAAAEVGGLVELVTADGDLRTLPCHLADQGGLDGFYAARLRRL
ncbi:MAG TPA: 16S rRNA (cytosine(967)-C(5))-methyltransferase RsmB, partial [Dongiaceae bacterium]